MTVPGGMAAGKFRVGDSVRLSEAVCPGREVTPESFRDG
jgi:hypothetical protein